MKFIWTILTTYAGEQDLKCGWSIIIKIFMITWICFATDTTQMASEFFEPRKQFQNLILQEKENK